MQKIIKAHLNRALSLGIILGLGLSTTSKAIAVSAQKSIMWKAEFEKGLVAQSDQKPSLAVAHFQKALQELQHEPHQAADLEQCLGKLGNAQMLHGQTRAAENTYNTLLNLLTKRYGANSEKVSPILIILGSIQESLGDHKTAMVFYHKALRNNEKNYGSYSPQFAANLHKIGKANMRAGNREGAIKNYKKAMTILAAEPGLDASSELRGLLKDYHDLIKTDESSNTALIKDFDSEIYGGKVPDQSSNTNHNNNNDDKIAGLPLNSAWHKRDQFLLQAENHTQLTEEPQIELRGLNNPAENPTSNQNLAPIFKTMSETIFRQSHFEKGEDYYKRKIAADVQALGPAHPTVANDLCGLAVLYNSEQKYSLARPLLERALPIYQKAWGQNNILTINTMATLATAQFYCGDADKASALYKEALNLGQAALGPNNLEVARILNDLAYLNYHQGKLNDACTFYEWALASTESAVGQRDPLVAACLQDYAQVLKSLGRASEAQANESRARSILASAP